MPKQRARKLRSNFIDIGPVPHKGIVYENEEGILEVKDWSLGKESS